MTIVPLCVKSKCTNPFTKTEGRESFRCKRDLGDYFESYQFVWCQGRFGHYVRQSGGHMPRFYWLDVAQWTHFPPRYCLIGSCDGRLRSRDVNLAVDAHSTVTVTDSSVQFYFHFH